MNKFRIDNEIKFHGALLAYNSQGTEEPIDDETVRQIPDGEWQIEKHELNQWYEERGL